MNTQDLKQALRNGPYAWPGGYPLYFLAADGGVLSFGAVRSELKQVFRAMRDKGSDPCWAIVATCVNWEDRGLCCGHTGELIPATYGDEEVAV